MCIQIIVCSAGEVTFMSSPTRVYIQKSKISNGIAIIEGKDADHLIKVMRLGVGSRFCICDGVSAEYGALITHVSDLYVEAAVGDKCEPDTEPYCPIVLYQCLPKGDKMDTVVQKAVELGVTDIVPVISDRCISRPDAKSLAKKIERWQRIAESAAAQSGRCRIPLLHSAVNFDTACAEMKGVRFLCYENEKTTQIGMLLKNVGQRTAGAISFIIGPEGGISDREAVIAQNGGIISVGLGGRILRTETASGFVLSALEILTHW